jgi:hypothetical protein
MRVASSFTVTENETNMAEKTNNGKAAAPGGAAPTKVDAVGQALAELGQDASRADIQSWVKKQFGYQMSHDHISDCKKNLARRAAGGSPRGRRKKPGPKPGAKKRAAANPEAAALAPAGVKEKISKREAVRRALEKLGDDAPLKDLQADIRKRFGYEMSTNHISTSKGELRRMAALGEPAPAGKETISKQEAIKRSLKKLGKRAMPKAIKEDIRQRFALEVSSNYISTTKADLLQKPTAKQLQSAAEPAAATTGTKAAVEMVDILVLRGLLDRLGAENLKAFIEAIAR